jgi:hypothetical protein
VRNRGLKEFPEGSGVTRIQAAVANSDGCGGGVAFTSDVNGEEGLARRGRDERIGCGECGQRRRRSR